MHGGMVCILWHVLRVTLQNRYKTHHTSMGSNLDQEEMDACTQGLLKRKHLQFRAFLTNNLYYSFTNIISYLCVPFCPGSRNFLHYRYYNICTLIVTYFIAVNFIEILVSAP